jgi:hypothetical protein
MTYILEILHQIEVQEGRRLVLEMFSKINQMTK